MSAIRPERLAGHLAPGLPASVAERLLGSPRLGDRVRAFAEGRLRDAEAAVAALPPAEAALARAGHAVLERAAVLAGATWNAPRVRALLRAAEVAAFAEAFGAEARTVALAHGDLTPPDPDDALPLHDAVRADGAVLLLGWRDALPPPIPEALALRWPLEEPEAAEDDPRRAAGRAVLARVAPVATMPDASP
ncbi:hypothetical protein ACE7GA_22335 [Roseomonas sp. CCTCC AB2023176]|uniref:hypothetical protein n=1 Tax=Roseomonas sp. CCTCC AB2023176 TaxID=3342640 RepID=UPI0035D542FB